MTDQTLFRKYNIDRLPIQGPPFGLDEQEKKIDDIGGGSVKSTVEYMMEIVRRKAAKATPPGLASEEREQRAEEAAQAALNHLVEMLDASLRDRHFHISADYLLNANNYYSYEFSLVVGEYAKAISDDERFHFNRGTRSIPPAMVWLTRPFSIAQKYEILPRLTAKFVNTDIRVSEVTGNRAVVQWWPTREAEHLPEQYCQAYFCMGCEVYKGVFAAIPRVSAGLPLAMVCDLRCRSDGDECYEWEFTWEAVATPRDPRPWLGLLWSLVLLILTLTPDLLAPALQKWIALLVPIPFLFAWYGSRLRQARAAEAHQSEQLREQQQQAEKQHDELLIAYGDLQSANVGLERKVRELTVLHKIGLTVTSTMNLGELLDQVLQVVREELRFDRAMIMLVDEERQVLTSGHAGGGTPEMTALIEQLEIPLIEEGWAPARAVLTGEPILVSSDNISPQAVELVKALQTSCFLVVPLQAKGQPIGVLAVDNAISTLPITEEDQDVLLTMGRTVAVGIENVRLYQAIEEHNRTLEKRVEERARQLRAVNEDLAREKEKLDAILRNIVDGLIVTDAEGTILLVNPAFENMFGRPAATLVGHSLTQVVAEEELQRLIANALQEQASTFTSDIPLPDGCILRASSAAIQEDTHTIGVVTVLRDITARKRAELGRERAIREKDALLSEFRAVLETIEYGVLLLDTELSTRAANRAFREMWGFPGEFIARQPTMAELINYNRDAGLYDVSRDEWDAYVEQQTEAVRQGKVPPTQFRLGDGRILRYQAMVLPGGGRMLTYFDITDLVRQNEYLAALHDTTLGLISRLDLGDLLEALISRAGQLVGTSHGFIYLVNPEQDALDRRVGVGVFSRLVGSHLKSGEGLAGKVWKTGQPLVVDDYDGWSGRSPSFDHNVIRALMGVPLKSGEEVVGVIGLAYDVESGRTFGDAEIELLDRFAQLASIALDNAQLYQEAQREKQYFESLVLNSPVAVVVIDLDSNVVSWNPTAEKLFGYAQAEALGRNIDDLVAADRNGRTEAIRAEAIAYSQQAIAGDLVHAITRRGRKDGTLVDVELLAVPVIVEGEQVGTFVIYHDITELQRARQEAEAANQAKSAFLATMSHEIRTPMNAVIGMTSLLLDTDLTPEQQDFVETVRTSGDALLTIINDILDFSKIEAGRMELESQPFDLRECVEGALDLVATAALDKGLNLGCFIDEQTPAAIFGDVTRMRQVLVNLLNNAVKFTERGEVVVSVNARFTGYGETRGEDEQAERTLFPRYELHLSVQDTGIGILPDRMDRLFQPFSQVDASTTRRYGGTGLGLVISKRLSELMGGTMWVESEESQGSTFHFTIQAQAAPAPVPAYLQEAQPDLSGRRVLIVDDSDTNRRILTLQTRSWGMLPQDTAFPAEALAWIRQGGPFDVVILDMQMPEMDGLTLAAEIQQERDAQALPLLMLTSLGQQEVELEEVEFAAFLTKPIKASQLYTVLVGIFAEAERLAEVDEVVVKRQFDAQMGERLPLRILLAEDNAVNQKLALRLLERMGYRADVAGNGLEAIEAVQRQTYDVVLMDVQMPEMDGLEATRAICREWTQEQRPRIIAMTAGAMKEDREKCLAAGMDDYVSKPIRVEELVRALSQCRSLGEDEQAKGVRTSRDSNGNGVT